MEPVSVSLEGGSMTITPSQGYGEPTDSRSKDLGVSVGSGRTPHISVVLKSRRKERPPNPRRKGQWHLVQFHYCNFTDTGSCRVYDTFLVTWRADVSSHTIGQRPGLCASVLWAPRQGLGIGRSGNPCLGYEKTILRCLGVKVF